MSAPNNSQNRFPTDNQHHTANGSMYPQSNNQHQDDPSIRSTDSHNRVSHYNDYHSNDRREPNYYDDQSYPREYHQGGRGGSRFSPYDRKRPDYRPYYNRGRGGYYRRGRGGRGGRGGYNQPSPYDKRDFSYERPNYSQRRPSYDGRNYIPRNDVPQGRSRSPPYRPHHMFNGNQPPPNLSPPQQPDFDHPYSPLAQAHPLNQPIPPSQGSYNRNVNEYYSNQNGPPPMYDYRPPLHYNNQNKEENRDFNNDNTEKDNSNNTQDKKGSRYFMMKVYDERDLEISLQQSIWATKKKSTMTLNNAYRDSDKVYFIFVIKARNMLFGYASMDTQIGKEYWYMRKYPWFDRHETRGKTFKIRWHKFAKLGFDNIEPMNNEMEGNCPIWNSRDSAEISQNEGSKLKDIIDKVNCQPDLHLLPPIPPPAYDRRYPPQQYFPPQYRYPPPHMGPPPHMSPSHQPGYMHPSPNEIPPPMQFPPNMNNQMGHGYDSRANTIPPPNQEISPNQQRSQRDIDQYSSFNGPPPMNQHPPQPIHHSQDQHPQQYQQEPNQHMNGENFNGQNKLMPPPVSISPKDKFKNKEKNDFDFVKPKNESPSLRRRKRII